MSDVILQRAQDSDDGTPGTWTHTASGWNCNTLELPDRANAEGKSRILAGIYPARLMWSQHFMRDLYHLLDVPDREAIEVHNGDWAGDVDKGKFSNVHGCILQGHGYSKINPYPDQLAIINSLLAVDQWIKFMDGKPFDLEIRDVQNSDAG
jgi:hypothetical protein